MTTREELFSDLYALVVEHDAMVRELTLPNVTSNALFVDLIVRMTDLLDQILAVPRAPESVGEEALVLRATSAIALALFIADLLDGMSSGSTRPAARALTRWFPPNRVAKIRADAAAVTPGDS